MQSMYPYFKGLLGGDSAILWYSITVTSIWARWRLNQQSHDCLLNRLFRRRSKKTSKLRITGLWAGNSPVTGEFPAQMVSHAENISIWWRHHAHVIMPSDVYLFFSDLRPRHWTNGINAPVPSLAGMGVIDFTRSDIMQWGFTSMFNLSTFRTSESRFRWCCCHVIYRPHHTQRCLTKRKGWERAIGGKVILMVLLKCT